MALLREVLTEITCIFSGMAEMDETDIAPRVGRLSAYYFRPLSLVTL